ncbi:hypothetical protein EDD85DRAFT_798669 [Armillaria nabsnona]|nr:hypothetical protein EDD85DRAFT_798669 [Armillaria nabsnona]
MDSAIETLKEAVFRSRFGACHLSGMGVVYLRNLRDTQPDVKSVLACGNTFRSGPTDGDVVDASFSSITTAAPPPATYTSILLKITVGRKRLDGAFCLAIDLFIDELADVLEHLHRQTSSVIHGALGSRARGAKVAAGIAPLHVDQLVRMRNASTIESTMNDCRRGGYSSVWQGTQGVPKDARVSCEPVAGGMVYPMNRSMSPSADISVTVGMWFDVSAVGIFEEFALIGSDMAYIQLGCMSNQNHLCGISTKASEDMLAIGVRRSGCIYDTWTGPCPKLQITGSVFSSTLHRIGLVFRIVLLPSERDWQRRDDGVERRSSPETLDLRKTLPHDYVRTNDAIHRNEGRRRLAPWQGTIFD